MTYQVGFSTFVSLFGMVFIIVITKLIRYVFCTLRQKIIIVEAVVPLLIVGVIMRTTNVHQGRDVHPQLAGFEPSDGYIESNSGTLMSQPKH